MTDPDKLFGGGLLQTPKYEGKNPPAKDDNIAFEHWLNQQLTDLFIQEADSDTPQPYDAERFGIEPLRQSYPHLAKYLHLPKMPKRGQRRTYTDDQVDWAMDDYRKALAIVKTAYGTTRRGRDLVSIVDIIARRHSFEPRIIENRLKNSSTCK